MFGWKKKYLKLEKKHEALQKKYDELCAMDCQKLYGDEVIKRMRAEQNAAAMKAKADSLDEMVLITNAWIATLVEVHGETMLPAEKLKANIESGMRPIVTFDHETDTYKLRMPGDAE